MTITILGASGFIGQRLVRHLLETTDHMLTIFCRSADRLDFGAGNEARLRRVAGKIDDPAAVARALAQADVAVYLIHLMGAADTDFYAAEAQAATVVGEVARRSGLGRVVYLGGLGNASEHMSQHLDSRNNTGRILAEHVSTTIELRAPMIVGEGSVGFDLMRTMVRKSPVVPIPRWGDQPNQPIAWQDVVAYLTAALTLETSGHEVVEIGGPEQINYGDIARRYASWAGKHPAVATIPGIPQAAVGAVIGRFKSDKDAAVGQDMVESLSYPMVVRDDSATRLFPDIKPRAIEAAFF